MSIDYEQVFTVMKQCFTEAGMKIDFEHINDDEVYIRSAIRYDGQTVILDSRHWPNTDYVIIRFVLGAVPPEAITRSRMLEGLNWMNRDITSGRISMEPESGTLCLQDEIFFTRAGLNKKQYSLMLNHLIKHYKVYMPRIQRLLSTNEHPETIFKILLLLTDNGIVEG